MVSRGVRVLILEDREADAKLMVNELRQARFDVQWTRVDSESEFLAQLQSAPDLILSDYTMPQFDALRALELLHDRNVDIPFIIVSGSIGEEIAVTAMRQGADDYLLKDRLGRLGQAVTAALGRKELREAHRHAQQGLRESEELFRSAFEDTNVPMVLTDLDHRFLRMNAAFARMFGYTQEEMLTLTMPDVTHPDDLAESFERRKALLAGRSQYFQMEKRYLRKDGQILWGLTNVSLVRDGSGRPRLYVGQVQDITERKRAEEALRASEERTRKILDTANDPFITINTAGHILDWNRQAERVFGWPREEVIGRKLSETVIPAQHREGHDRGLAGFAATGRGRMVNERIEITAVSRSGAEFPVELMIWPTYVGSTCTISAFVRDITERKQRKQLEDQYRQAQKMEAVGRLAGGVAHDFNNLLTIINGYSELVLDGLQPDNPLRNLITEIKKAGDRAVGLTRQLLAFSRKQVLVAVVLDLNGLLWEMERMLKRLIGEDIELSLRTEPALWSIKADPGQIEQIVMNLVVNARDAMPTGGKVTIETKNVELDEGYVGSHAEVQPGRYVLLAVTDSGYSMDAATKARVFEPFFTTKGEKGTGLGLATVYGIVKQSGGHIEVYSEPGVGSTFKTYLPEFTGPESRASSHRNVGANLLGTETILLVEDEGRVRSLAHAILDKLGYKILESANGEEAMAVCQAFQQPIHLLITDVIMPKVSGRELAARLTALRPTMKVLCVSGYTDDAIVHHGVLDATMPFLQKPFTAESLARKVREVLDQEAPAAPAT